MRWADTLFTSARAAIMDIDVDDVEDEVVSVIVVVVVMEAGDAMQKRNTMRTKGLEKQ